MASHAATGRGEAGRLALASLWPVLILVVLVVVSYLPAMLWGGFVWDDVILAKSKAVPEWSGLWRIWLQPTEAVGGEGHYWPLVYTTFWLEHKLWGFAPAGYHVVNVALHLANTVLLWHLLGRLAVPGPLLIAAVFAVHPLHVESVAWVIERKDVLSGLFYLAAWLVWMRFVEAPSRRRYVLALALFTAGLLSKSIVVTLPATLLVWHWWKQGRIAVRDLLRLAPFFAVGLVITVGDLLRYIPGEAYSFDFTLVERALIAARALWFYGWKLVWPTDLAVIYPRWDISIADPLGWGCLAASIAAAAALWLSRHRIGRGPLAGALFFAITLSPVLGFVDYGYMQFSFVADRFQYLAGIGVMGLLAGAAAHGASRWSGAARRGAQAGAAAVVLILAALTWQQASLYRDNIRFYGHIASSNPEAWKIHLNLGRELFLAGRLEEALENVLIAEKKRPDDAATFATAGGILVKLERLDEAERRLRHARKLNPRDPVALQNLAALLRKQGRYEEATDTAEEALSLLPPDSPEAVSFHVILGRIAEDLERPQAAEQHYRSALQIAPRHLATLEALAVLYFEQQRYEEAMVRFRAVVEIDPDNAPAYSNIGATLHHLDRSEEALASFERALALDPTLESARTGRSGAQARLHRDPEYEEALERGRTRLEEGRLEEALAATRTALGKRPDSVEANVNLSAVLIAMGRVADAEDSLRRASRSNPGNLDILQNLGESLRVQERYEEAVEVYTEIIESSPDRPLTHAALGDTLFRLQRYDEAVAALERARALAPDASFVPSLHVLAGRAELAAGRPGAALEAFDRALAIDPALAGATAGRERALQAMEQRGR